VEELLVAVKVAETVIMVDRAFQSHSGIELVSDLPKAVIEHRYVIATD
jgi:hypothetical protein